MDVYFVSYLHTASVS